MPWILGIIGLVGTAGWIAYDMLTPDKAKQMTEYERAQYELAKKQQEAAAKAQSDQVKYMWVLGIASVILTGLYFIMRKPKAPAAAPKDGPA